ncbi:hypothetical protein EBU95_03965 [bacterium]|nr:hypothetical protein [bacterium]
MNKIKFLVLLLVSSVSFSLTPAQAIELLVTSNTQKETRKKIAVIDSGIDLNNEKLKPYICNVGSYDFTGEGLQDTHGHGSNVSWLIVKDLSPKEYCVMALKYYASRSNPNGLEWEVKALSRAVEFGAVLINFSGGGLYSSSSESMVIFQALSKGIKVVVAAGNEGNDLSKNCNYFPACAVKDKNFYVVGSVYENGQRVPSSNYNGPVSNWEIGYMQEGPDGRKMTGTSQATAVFSGKLLKNMENR